MDQGFEQDIPMWALIAGFAVLMVVSTVVRKWQTKRKNIRQGQLLTEGERIPTIEERVAGNREWASGEIRSRGRVFTIVLGIGAVAMNLTVGTAFIKSFSNPDIKTAPMIVLGVFTAIGIAFAVIAVRLALQYLRFGESRCRIEGKAGVLGKNIAGVVRTNNSIEATGDYTFDLQCMETYHTGSGKNRRTKTKTHWQAKQQVDRSGKSSKYGIPFNFSLPNHAPETGYQLARGDVSWQLRIHAPVEGVDYSTQFTVPVFKMDYSD